MRSRGLLIVVSGPSGAGKGTLCKELLIQCDEIKSSVSVTTRAPRDGEQEGLNYYFVAKEKFETMIEEDQFLEYAEVYGNYYGTPKKVVIDQIQSGKDILLEIDIQGALQVRQKYREGVFIFIIPPSMAELKNRIIKRGSETEASLETRFSSAFSEIEYMSKYDYFVVNDTIDSAVDQLMSIIKAEKCRILDENIEKIIHEFKEER